MKITKIQLAENKYYYKNKKKNKTNVTQRIPTQMNAYQNFNINFRGRTPENFYAQEFNVKHMPKTMKEYLHQDYESRKYMPPEQVMSESFKYLSIIENFADVKSTYPDEPLFSRLREPNIKGRTGILSDIKLSRELSDTPLFNDGSDNLGIYLLKKIYLGGKTLKEINKDFYEKDLNPEYKGAITQPITYSTTSAYGIQYPKTDFWNSFIATRDEYKKFFVDIPKRDKTDLKKELEKFHQKKEVPKKTYTRKYVIKKYQKELIKKDVIKTKGELKALEGAIRKRYSKNDPEAAFIVKYLSPVMTIAADRIHLSEEEKYFADCQKAAGKKVENFFAQFWKANPHLLEQYSTAITDTIELFEETYASGGTIPINNDYRVVREGVKNQKIIDFVPKEFIELLDHVQTIVPSRLKFYAEHEKAQNEWEEHFKWRYGEVQDKMETQNKIPPEEILKQAAAANNAQIYHLKGINGDDLTISAKLDETVGDYIRAENAEFPTKFVNLFINKALNHPLMTEDAKLSFSTIQIADKINDDRILGKSELTCILNAIRSELSKEIAPASMAVMDVYATLTEAPVKIYRNIFQDNDTDVLMEASNEYNLVYMMHSTDPETKLQIDRLYEAYKKPMTNSELTKVMIAIMNFIRNFNPECINSKDSVLYKQNGVIDDIKSISDLIKKKSDISTIKMKMRQTLTDISYAKSLLFCQHQKNIYKLKSEVIVSLLINNLRM